MLFPCFARKLTDLFSFSLFLASDSTLPMLLNLLLILPLTPVPDHSVPLTTLNPTLPRSTFNTVTLPLSVAAHPFKVLDKWKKVTSWSRLKVVVVRCITSTVNPFKRFKLGKTRSLSTVFLNLQIADSVSLFSSSFIDAPKSSRRPQNTVQSHTDLTEEYLERSEDTLLLTLNTELLPNNFPKPTRLLTLPLLELP